ncbi:glycosyltransferase [Flavobacterium maritimum]|uniref:glycosyltransferase n=1 Tax=Flavobacterium maritimum TaxID=3149042 RepID=UPI0032B39F3C
MNILYITNTKTTWTNNDYEILAKHFNVSNNFIGSFESILKSLNPFFILKHDVVIFWFASLSFSPILFLSWILRKKIIIIAGGYDVVKVSDTKYGAFCDSWPKRMIRKLMFIAADKVVSISFSNQREALENANVPISRSVMIYHGFVDPKISVQTFEERKKQVVTVGIINDETYIRKGYKYFFELAQIMPDWDFIHIGKVTEDFQHMVDFHKCKNLSMMGFLPTKRFNEVLNESKFYLQLSNHEGFGCSIVDAALMGCYPIVFDRYAMREVVQGCGEIIEFPNIELVQCKIRELENANLNVEDIRLHYLKKFPNESREERLVNVISSLF